MNFIDGSARGLPPSGNTFYQMKSRDTFAPMGPYLVTADEVPRPAQPARCGCGSTARSSRTSTPATWRTRSRAASSGSRRSTRSSPATCWPLGTNHRGLSAFQDGDLVELETEGLGRLHVNVRDELKRTWARETRLDRQEQEARRHDAAAHRQARAGTPLTPSHRRVPPMKVATDLDIPSLQDRVPPEEWAVRVDLAAAIGWWRTSAGRIWCSRTSRRGSRARRISS